MSEDIFSGGPGTADAVPTRRAGKTGTGAFRPEGMIGSSLALWRLLDMAGHAARSPLPVFLYGESGTGKDLLARGLHDAACPPGAPFVTLNLAATPAALLDRELLGPAQIHAVPWPQAPRHLALSHGGTLYLDDVCRAAPATQARLVDFLRAPRILLADGRETEWTGRIVAASNLDPHAEMNERRFRRDLFDQLSAVYLILPPLRRRNGDAAEIAAALFPSILARLGLPPRDLPAALLAELGVLPWPGNVRQLLNALQRMALSPELAAGRLPEIPADARADVRPRPDEDPPMTFAEIERRAILSAIDRHGGSVPRASEELKLAASTIYRKLKQWQL